MARTIIVSNRLPVKITKEDKGLKFKPSEGGLATGLGSIYKEGDNLWIGWPGIPVSRDKEKDEINRHLKKENMSAVYLTKAEIKDFYEGFSNETLWPIFHYFNQDAVYDQDLYDAYEKVNKKFCDAVLKFAQPGDTIWIHDYQLLLLPGLIRKVRPDITIGFFLHIPFPSFEVFRLIPWRRQLLDGILGSDLVGFHTYDDMRHFLSAVSRIVAIGNQQGMITKGNRSIVVDSFPMGIDYEKYARSAQMPATLEREVRYRTSIGNQKLILTIDRLDYSKGIPKRLEAFELFLQRNPEWHGKVSMLMVVVPSRDQVDKYRRLKVEIDELVGRINGSFSRLNWTPIHYFYRSFPLEALSAFYRMANVALVTPMRDGMNLVCKEFIASKLDQKGVLILSEMAGASKELSDAIIINPNDVNQMVEAIEQALTMPEEEQIMHMKVMQNTVKRYNIHHWVDLFFTRLKEIKEVQAGYTTHRLDKVIKDQMMADFAEAKQRLLFLDYDGTLMPFVSNPEASLPDAPLLKIIKNLTALPDTRVVVISGRPRSFLQKVLGEQHVDLISDHGAWSRPQGGDWEPMIPMETDWMSEMRTVMEVYVDRTPGSFVEEKEFSIAWHYRKVETGLGELRMRELSSHLKYLVRDVSLQVLEGDMVLEVKSNDVNKGKASAKWSMSHPADFVLAAGDDMTDEDTFRALDDKAYTIKVGGTASAARFNVESVDDVRALLKQIVKTAKK